MAHILVLLGSAIFDVLEVNIMDRDTHILCTLILPLKYSRSSTDIHKTPVKRVGSTKKKNKVQRMLSSTYDDINDS